MLEEDGAKSNLSVLWDRMVEKVFIGILLLNAVGLLFMGYLAWTTPKATEAGVPLVVLAVWKRRRRPPCATLMPNLAQNGRCGTSRAAWALLVSQHHLAGGIGAGSGLNRLHQRPDADDVHHPREIVGEDG
jgi:hypothetical protein